MEESDLDSWTLMRTCSLTPRNNVRLGDKMYLTQRLATSLLREYNTSVSVPMLVSAGNLQQNRKPSRSVLVSQLTSQPQGHTTLLFCSEHKGLSVVFFLLLRGTVLCPACSWY